MVPPPPTPIATPAPPLPPPLFTPRNERCGPPFLVKPPSSFRVWSNNVNGLSLANDGAQLHELCLELQAHRVDCICLQETNADFLQSAAREKIHHILQLHFGVVRMITSTSCIRAPTFWKPGGTAIFLVGKWAGAAVDTHTDDMGRWCSFTLRGQQDEIFTVYSVYNVVDTNIGNAGPSTVYSQQWQLLKLAGQHQPNPRKQFIKDLHQELQPRHGAGEHILLCGDFNERFGSNPALMSSVCVDMDLFDVHDYVLGDEARIPTYARGSTRLDYCLLSTSLTSHVLQAGINQYHEIFNSDHRALFVDINLRLLLGRLPPQMKAPQYRLISSDSSLVETFINKVYTHLEENNGFDKYHSFLQSVALQTKPWIEANKLDDILGQALHAGENACKYRPKACVLCAPGCFL